MTSPTPNPAVLLTDYAWPTLDVEHAVLDPAGIELVVAPVGDEVDLIRLAPGKDAILTCWNDVSASVLDAATSCKVVSTYGIGVDNIAVDRATELGIRSPTFPITVSTKSPITQWPSFSPAPAGSCRSQLKAARGSGSRDRPRTSTDSAGNVLA